MPTSRRGVTYGDGRRRGCRATGHSFHLTSTSSAAQSSRTMVTGRGKLYLGAFADFSGNSVISDASWYSWRTAGAADARGGCRFGQAIGLPADRRVMTRHEGRHEDHHRAVQDQD